MRGESSSLEGLTPHALANVSTAETTTVYAYSPALAEFTFFDPPHVDGEEARTIPATERESETRFGGVHPQPPASGTHHGGARLRRQRVQRTSGAVRQNQGVGEQPLHRRCARTAGHSPSGRSTGHRNAV